MTQPAIEFDGYQIQKLVYSKMEISNDKEAENELERKISIGITEDNKNAMIVLSVFLIDKERRKSVELVIEGFFTINSALSEEKIEQLLKENGVALIYPYARSIISNATSLDSPEAIIIPVLNTTIYE